MSHPGQPLFVRKQFPIHAAPNATFRNRVPTSAAPSAFPRNKILASLTLDAWERVLPLLRSVQLTIGQSLIMPHTAINSVYFIEQGLVSLVTTLDNGSQAEVGLVGNEGMIGMPLIHGVNDACSEAFVQASGSAFQMDAIAFRHVLERQPALQQHLFCYYEAMHGQAVQTAACNGHHNLEQRLARWLLMAHDRVDGDTILVTQEFLSLMLCVYRPRVTVVAGNLQRAGLIWYERGKVVVLDRQGLEQASCDCYNIVNRRFKILLGA